jgi:hypothetical protein
MTLLDDDSRAVLGLLRQAGSEPQQVLQRSQAAHGQRVPLVSDITNRQHMVTMLLFDMPLRCIRLSCHEQPHLPLMCLLMRRWIARAIGQA